MLGGEASGSAVASAHVSSPEGARVKIGAMYRSQVKLGF